MLDAFFGYADGWWWLLALSVFAFFASLAAVSAIIVFLPADYFRRDQRPPSALERRHPVVRAALHVAKQALGLVLVSIGVLMLLTPGQGVLTILIGVTLLDFPGKYALERRLVSRPAVRRAIDWVRLRAGRAPLEL